jgi:hypothetical protein
MSETFYELPVSRLLELKAAEQAVRELRVELVRVETERDEAVNAVAEVVAAIRNPGPRPDYHRWVMETHRDQWPSLWQALDRLLAGLSKEDTP